VALTTHRRASPLAGGEDGLDDMTVKVEMSSGALRIRASHPADPKQRKYQVSFVVKVPPHTPVRLRTDHGSLRVLGVICDVKGRTGAGEVRARNVKGTVQLTTAAGNIELSGQVPRFELESGLGDIRLTLRPGVTPQGDSRARTHKGDIHLNLPADRKTTLTAESRGRKIHSNLPARTERPGLMRAVLAGGGPGITLHSNQGEIRIRTIERRTGGAGRAR
jgi:hypothetical protein